MDGIKDFLKVWKDIAATIVVTVITGLISFFWLVDLVQSGLIKGVVEASGTNGIRFAEKNYEFSGIWSFWITLAGWVLASGTLFAVILYRRHHSASGLQKKLSGLKKDLEEASGKTQKLSSAYSSCCNSLYSVVHQMYLGGEAPRHHLEKVYVECEVDADLSTSILERVRIRPAGQHALHFWKRFIDCDDGAPAVTLLSDLEYRVKDCGKNSVSCLPLKDSPRKKEAAIFFLPEMQPSEAREIEIRYRWPGWFQELQDRGEARFVFSFRNGSRDGSELVMVVKFDRALGEITCLDQSPQRSEHAPPNKSIEPAGGTTWTLQIPNAQLEGVKYCLLFAKAPVA